MKRQQPTLLEGYLNRHAESEGNLRPELVAGRFNQVPLSVKRKKQA